MVDLVSQSPWWGGPIIAGLAALLGAGLTLFITQKRTDQRRWDDIILDTCVAVENVASELAELGRKGWPKYIEDGEQRVQRHIELTEAINEARHKFRFVASKKLVEATGDLYEVAFHESLGFVHEPVLQFERARKAFVEAARKELRAN